MAVLIPEQNMSQFSGLVKRIDGLSERCLNASEVVAVRGDVIVAAQSDLTRSVLADYASFDPLTQYAVGICAVGNADTTDGTSTLVIHDAVIVHTEVNGTFTKGELQRLFNSVGITFQEAMSEHKYGQL